MELLRIVAMLMILLLHINFGATGRPSPEACHAAPPGVWMRYFFQSLAEPAVNVFVMISGWFGIRFRYSRLAGLLFQCVFIGGLIWLAALVTGFADPWGVKHIVSVVLFTTNVWFVKSYIILYLLAPVLNAFVDRAGRGASGVLVMLFMACAVVYGWTDAAPEFMMGYSALSFVMLYLLARFLKIHCSEPLSRRTSGQWLTVFLAAVTVNSVLSFAVTYTAAPAMADSMLHAYLNPLNILAAVALICAFSRFRFQNRFINWTARSCLAVFLFHKGTLIGPLYGAAGWRFFTQFSGPVYALVCLGFMLLVFAASVLVDQLRLAAWKPLEQRFITWENGWPDLNLSRPEPRS